MCFQEMYVSWAQEIHKLNKPGPNNPSKITPTLGKQVV